MSATPDQIKQSERGRVVRAVEAIGEGTMRQSRSALGFFAFMGGLVCLAGETFTWVFRSLVAHKVRFGRENLFAQMVRVGVRSIPIVSLVPSR